MNSVAWSGSVVRFNRFTQPNGNGKSCDVVKGAIAGGSMHFRPRSKAIPSMERGWRGRLRMSLGIGSPFGLGPYDSHDLS